MMRVRRSAALRALLPAPGAGREEDRCFLVSSCHLGFPNRGAGDVRSRRGVLPPAPPPPSRASIAERAVIWYLDFYRESMGIYR